MRVHIFQHVSFEGIGSIGAWLDRRRVVPSFTRYDAGGTPPPPRDYDALIVMGGPMSVNDGDRHPWLATETRAIADAMNAGRRVLGVCLGAQLIAHALGCRVFPNATKEIGWAAVHRVGPARGPLAALPNVPSSSSGTGRPSISLPVP